MIDQSKISLCTASCSKMPLMIYNSILFYRCISYTEARPGYSPSSWYDATPGNDATTLTPR